jgi:hypothetical protein
MVLNHRDPRVVQLAVKFIFLTTKNTRHEDHEGVDAPGWRDYPAARCSAGFVARARLCAELTSAMCEKACGKLPTRRCASSSRPMSSRASTSQKLHARNAPSPGGRPSGSSVCRITTNESIDEQVTLNGLDRAPDAPICRRQEAGRGQEKKAGVELLRAVRLDEAAKLRVEPAGTPRRGCGDGRRATWRAGLRDTALRSLECRDPRRPTP